jgi:hypothetical protein
MTSQFPEVGDWVTVGYARSTMCWGTVVAKNDRGLVIDARAVGSTHIPSGSRSRDLFLPWTSIDFIQGADNEEKK